MAKIIEFPSSISYWTGEVKCQNCKHTWVGSAPIGVIQCECPKCNSMKGLPQLPIDVPKDELVWKCSCGNQTHFITEKGVHCYNCGNLTSYIDLAESW